MKIANNTFSLTMSIPYCRSTHSWSTCLLSNLPLNKNPVARGFEELSENVLIRGAARLLQIATNFQSSAEASKYLIKEILEDKNTEAVILVVASGACGSPNRGEDASYLSKVV